MTGRADDPTGAASFDPVDLEDDGESPDDLLSVPDPGSADTAESGPGPESQTILTDVFALTKERDEFLGALQRLQADFENYRKRVLRQQEEQSARAAVDLVSKLLPVLDTLDLAQAHLVRDEEGEPGHDGQALLQARAQLLDALKKEGLVVVDEVGVPFDPEIHDAVAHSPAETDEDDGSAGTVVDEVLRAGYRWRSQMLRPAMVRVKG
jgi:molecular chaperone GrpE